jgi:hypothetical protein
MYNSSSIEGNVHSSGPISGTSNYVRGDVLSAGPDGLIDKIHATSSAYAHTIKDSTVDKNAYYVTLINTTVGGFLFPDSSDQATSSLPISDEQIDEWELAAANGGDVTCTDGVYTIDGNVTIGPKKIPCDLDVVDGIVTLTGALWVTGNVDFTNTPTIRISPLYIDKTIPIIANGLDDVNGSTIILRNATSFQGSGSNSYVLLISRNTSAEGGGEVDAIWAGQSVSGEVLLYSPHGNITMENSVNLREVTGYKLTTRNTAKIVYKSGLANILFSSGPSGGYVPDSWQEVY